MSTLAQQFIANKGQPLEVEGRTVINMYRRPVKANQIVAVNVQAAFSSPVQGLRIKLDNGSIRINDHLFQDVAVWFDSAPPQFEFSCHPKKATAELRIWNCWRDNNGVSQAWIGNAGIVVEEASTEVVLHCSSGTMEFDPNQLTVKLIF